MAARVVALVLLFVGDRLLKNMLWFTPPDPDQVFFIRPLLNENISFSLPLPDVLQWFFLPAIIIITAVIFFHTARLYRKHDMLFFLWGMIGIGALSNLMDRITLGGVFDYIDVGFWPVFNLSDSYIFIGVAFLIARELFAKRKKA
ncbi:MAG: signal peptidase II [Patescibacteria group bacterium]